MTPLDLFAEARRALAAHPLRAGLASIGIVVGVATVMASIAVGEGARRAALADVSALGVDNVFVRAVSSAGDPKRKAAAPVLTRADARAVEGAAGVDAVSILRYKTVEIAIGARAATAPFAGADPAWGRIAGVRLARGRWLADADARASKQVAVVGAALAARLSPGGLPLGAALVANGQMLRVIGVLAPSGATAAGTTLQLFDTDNAVIVPSTVMDARLGDGDDPDRASAIAVRVAPGADVTGVSRAIGELVGRRHGGNRLHGGSGEFELVVPRELLRAKLRAQRTFDAVLISTGLIALLISGVGIMNIMLATVAERVQEIGIRRAFGARRRHIVSQFALEAALLCAGGAGLGVPLGIGLAWAVSGLSDWPVVISSRSVALALALAVSVGLVFGIYPARRAAVIDPIEALRA